MSIRVHSKLDLSHSNGPGKRAVIWFQGCSLLCEGCFNPLSHSSSIGSIESVTDIITWLLTIQSNIEGVTISGGEPFQQMIGLVELVKQIKSETDLSIVLFSGYNWEEILSFPKFSLISNKIDVLIAGRYIQSLRSARRLIGSTNKTFHFFSDRYSISDFEEIPEAEIVIDSAGTVVQTGIEIVHLE